MENKIRSVTCSAIAAFGLMSLSCEGSSAKDLTFGYVPTSMSYPYNVATAVGFQEAAKSAGVKAVVLDPKGDIANQGNAIDDLVAQHVDAIGFLPLDPIVAESFVDKTNKAGVPLVAIAQQVGDAAKRPLNDVYPGLSALVAPDDEVEGEQAGKLAASLLPKDHTAKIGIVEGAPGYTIVGLRTGGFKKALDAAGVKYVIASSQPTDWTPEKGEVVCQNMLAATPDMDLIFSQADDMAIGCARAISAAGSKVKLVATGGGSKLGNAAIAAGELYGSVCVKPETLGRMMFKAMYEAATDPKTPRARFVGIETPIVTAKNLKDCPAQW